MLEPTTVYHHGGRDTEVRERVSVSRFLRKASNQGPVLLIRTINPTGGFQKTVSLRAGQLRVIDASASDELGIVYEALGKGGAAHSLRLGARELLRTEINSVIGSLNVVSLTITTHALIADAVPPRVVTSLIKRIGLSDRGGVPYQLLSACEKQRMRIALALYSPCPVIYLHEPLTGLSPEWREPMAELIAEVAQGSSQIFVVTTEKRLPQVWSNWNGSEKAKVRVTSGQDPFGLSLADYKVREVTEALERLLHLQSQPNGGDLGVIITRPQSVSKTNLRAVSRDLVGTEIIRNPGFDSEPGPLVRVGRREIARARKATARKTLCSSQLTTVTPFERLMRFSVCRNVMESVYAMKNRWVERNRVERTTLPAVRISMLRRREYLWHTFVVPTILVFLIAFVVHYVY